jgi:hypothetical protein
MTIKIGGKRTWKKYYILKPFDFMLMFHKTGYLFHPNFTDQIGASALSEWILIIDIIISL